MESKFVAKSNNVFMIISHDFMSYYYDDAKVLESPKYQEWQNDNINNKSSSSASIFHPDWQLSRNEQKVPTYCWKTPKHRVFFEFQ